MAEAEEVSRAHSGGRLAGMAREPRTVALRRADVQRADQQGSKAVTSSRAGGASSESARPDPGPNAYRLAFLRFAQYAFIRLDKAFRAAAFIPRRFCLGLDFVLG